MIKAKLLAACFTFGIILSAAGLVRAGNVWNSKAYPLWKKAEAERILRQSPWTTEYQWGYIGSIADNVQGSGDSEREFITIIRVHLFSARVLRQAYAVVSADGKPDRLASLAKFVDRNYDREIVISWTVDSVPKGVTAVFDIDRTLRALSVADLKTTTFLATNLGKKVYLMDYIPPTPDGTGAKFIFPRYLPDGRELISADDKTIKFQTISFKIKTTDFPDDYQGTTQTRVFLDDYRQLKENTLNIDVTFKVKDLLVKGRLDY